MPGFTERQRTWKQELRETQPEVFFPGTELEMTVSPVERIRYRERARFGALLMEDLSWLLAREGKLDDAEIIQHHAVLMQQGLTEDQQHRLTLMHEMLLRQLHLTRSIGRQELLHRVQRFMDAKTNGLGAFRLTNVPHEDIEVTPFGAVVVTIRDRHMWEEELGFSPTSRGKKKRSLQHTVDQIPKRLREAYNRLVFVRARPDVDERLTRTHELFHDLYRLLFRKVLETDYRNPSMAWVFKDLKNELIAYGLSEQWQLHLAKLLNIKDPHEGTDILNGVFEQNEVLRVRIAKNIERDYLLHGVTQEEAIVQTKRFTLDLRRLEYLLSKHALCRSQAFQPWLASLLVSGSVKELVYHLHATDPGFPDADLHITREPGGFVPYRPVKRLVRWSIFHAFPIAHLDRLVQSIQATLAHDLKSLDGLTPEFIPDLEGQISGWQTILERIERYRDVLDPH